MSVTANFNQCRSSVGKHDRNMVGIASVFLVVTVLTSESLWAVLLDRVGAEDNAYADQDEDAVITVEEKQLLWKLTETPEPPNQLTPMEATKRNQAIPFAHTPVAVAKPFQLLNADVGAGLTALRCLTQAVYYEAAFEPLAGRRAVAQVVLNRMKHPAFPNSVCGVVYQGVNKPVCQFSFTCDGSLNRRPSPAAWNEAEKVAREALNGHVEQHVGYATHYHANYVSPYWAPKLVKIAKIGAHIFYRWPGGWGLPRSFTDQYAGVEAIPNILPRSFVRRNNDGARAASASGPFATGQHPGSAGPESQTETDVGGRIDVSKGWTAALPEPEETRRSSRMIARQQSGEFEVVASGDGR